MDGFFQFLKIKHRCLRRVELKIENRFDCLARYNPNTGLIYMPEEGAGTAMWCLVMLHEVRHVLQSNVGILFSMTHEQRENDADRWALSNMHLIAEYGIRFNPRDLSFRWRKFRKNKRCLPIEFKLFGYRQLPRPSFGAENGC